MFIPKLGEDESNLTSIFFSIGLVQPPTSLTVWISKWLESPSDLIKYCLIKNHHLSFTSHFFTHFSREDLDDVSCDSPARWYLSQRGRWMCRGRSRHRGGFGWSGGQWHFGHDQLQGVPHGRQGPSECTPLKMESAGGLVGRSPIAPSQWVMGSVGSSR